MDKKHYNVLGVMSGTSLDGIDVAYCTFEKHETWNFEIIAAETFSYPASWLSKLKDLVKLSPEELLYLDEDYTVFLSEVINAFISKNNISGLDAVCSHGHTALHQPENKLTYQIGNLPKLATLLNEKVVCDFRVEDVALGGQGAPLVPIGDQFLFPQYDFCLNLGGFANISMQNNGKRIAYDICPVNIVLNHYVSALGLEYDDGGQIAASGVIHQPLLEVLNALDFYKSPYPKSLGLEWVKTEILPLIDTYQLSIQDILSTVVEHVALQISNEINKKRDASVLTTGGGAFNTFLMETLAHNSHNQIVIPDTAFVENKEALIFAFLGVLKLRGENNCLSSVTGAVKDHSSGKIYYP
ncbi:anhydro-N-acetylmuramic acid kinase [Gelidibacter salicanalis]|uniref:Anhydro-N-acetylmuramic acid kinase n=1 Tax=Gelidibacter salicanalis TaxID=291193 RepID=A0A934NKG5_9FLAO|nr:anhydro-N-acetylmuramic acid kinase [Gelidibacter salicanalis]MBJ7880472.1 anhydro-N-acetylmuramic acid kinase [Gelidibacter salicanalis]